MTLGNTFKTPQGSLDMSTGLMVDGANPNGVDPKKMTWGVAGWDQPWWWRWKGSTGRSSGCGLDTGTSFVDYL